MNNFVGSNPVSWDYCNTGHKITNGSQQNYAPTYAQGDRVGVVVDLDKFTIGYTKNGAWYGVAYNLPNTYLNQ
jgi:hypothetical protein